MKYLDSDNEAPPHLKEIVLALQVVKTAVNIQCQFSEESMKKAIILLEENSLDTSAFIRVANRIKKKYF